MAILVLAPVGASGTGPAQPGPVMHAATGSLVGPAAVIRDVRANRRGDATAVTLVGTARLVASRIDEPSDAPRRLVIDLPYVASAVPGVTTIGVGPVERVRVGLDPRAPLSTQVTLDLARQAPYHVESSPDGHDLTIVFDQQVPDPVAALGAPPAPAQAAAPAAPAAASAVPAAAAVPAPRFTGHPISLDFQDADLVAVLRTFAEISGLNLMIDPGVRGTVTTQLRDVPWDHALDMILRTNRLGYSVDGTIVRVAPLGVLANEEEERRKLAEAQALAGELQVMTRTLSYARAGDLTTLLTQTVLSRRGSVQTDARTNTIIINDLPERLQQADQLLGTLDRPEPQVEIEARIVQTTRDFARQIGVSWGASARAGSLAMGDAVQADAVGSVIMPALGAPSQLAVGLSGALDLDVALSALERQGQGASSRRRASPRRTTSRPRSRRASRFRSRRSRTTP
jgi:type IV pilus assembly protein PilQ